MWIQETPSGLINGVNLVYTLSAPAKQAASTFVFLTGLFVPPAAYSVVGSTVTFVVAPAISSVLTVAYIRKTGEN